MRIKKGMQVTFKHPTSYWFIVQDINRDWAILVNGEGTYQGTAKLSELKEYKKDEK